MAIAKSCFLLFVLLYQKRTTTYKPGTNAHYVLPLLVGSVVRLGHIGGIPFVYWLEHTKQGCIDYLQTYRNEMS